MLSDPLERNSGGLDHENASVVEYASGVDDKPLEIPTATNASPL